MMLNGVIAALVAITAASGFVAPWAAIVIGAVAGSVAVVGVLAIERIRIDDPIGAVAVHMMAGIWGTLSIGLFATGQFGAAGPAGPDVSLGTVEGLFYGGGTSQLVIQFIGSVSCIVAVSLASIVVFKIIRSLPGSWNLRLEKELELEGIDITEHGTTAYHMEFGQGMNYSTPAGLGSPLPGLSSEPADSVN
jgi:Amt family ammonium transporter